MKKSLKTDPAEKEFLENIRNSNRQLAKDGLEIRRMGTLTKNPDGIIILGMGGSALPGKLLKSFKKELGIKVPIIVWTDYSLPDLQTENIKRPVYIFVSHSGNTEETLSGFKEIFGKKSRSVAVVAGGGTLKGLAESKKVALASFPSGSLTPRQDTGKMFFCILEILKAVRLISKNFSFARLNPGRFQKTGEALAKKLQKKLILIYTEEKNGVLGYIWKIKINETSKHPAFSNTLPEMNHNEIVGFEKNPFPTAAIFLESGRKDRLGRRIEITKKLLRGEGAEVISVNLEGKSRMEQVWNSIMLADWTSYFLAKLNGKAPAPVKIVEKLKALMKG